MNRIAEIERKTSETDIKLRINLDGEGNYNIDTGVNFFNHVLESFSKHSFFDLDIKSIGDLEVDDHHTIEDIGMVLGEAFLKAIDDKKGIKRMAHAIVPMDDSLSTVAIDIGGRGYSLVDISFNNYKIGDMTSEIIPHFFESFTSTAKININIKVTGSNDHHKVESLFKSFAKALKEATRIEHDKIPSTKGVI
ncbi:MAG: imidazoleglycerol-phosphate dehydratase HisB [Methanobrevibacter sp.]|jgi:imidazoleglycerol-phosphate dehydratase|nr:imidazoleglycerol-phosphate dehydratase HisB [Candidatus Methanovirga basalitermitum]